MAKAKPTGPEALILEQPAYTAPHSDPVEAPAGGEPTAQAIPDVVDTPGPGPAPDEILIDVAPDLVKARVLAASAYGQPNDVIEIDAALAQTIPDVVDTSPEAVAYAESLANEQ